MRSLFLLTCLLYTSFAFTQDPSQAGYIVKNNDTLKGRLDDGMEQNFVQGVRFKKGASPADFLNASDISAFGFADGRIYRLVNYVNPLDSNRPARHFAKCLFEGSFEVYSFIKEDNFFFLVVQKDTAYLLHDDLNRGNGQIRHAGNYKKQLFFLSYNCQNLDIDVIDRVSYFEPDLVGYFIDLQKCRDNAINPKIHFKKGRTENKIFVYGGGIRAGNSFEITARAFVRMPATTLNKKAFFNVGISYSHQRLEDHILVGASRYDRLVETIDLYGAVQYFFTKNTVRPYLFGGLVFGVVRRNDRSGTIVTTLEYKARFLINVIVSAGIEASIPKRVIIKADWRYEYVSHYPTLGIAYRIMQY